MQLLECHQIRNWDAFTISHEPITSLDLMERAAASCCQWLMDNGYQGKCFSIFCGKGNNGGDGLAMARILSAKGFNVAVYILEFGHLGSADFQANLQRLHETKVALHYISDQALLPVIPKGDILVDALLGTGLNKPMEGLWVSVVQHLNQSGNEIISIDIPSGVFADESSLLSTCIHATHTLSFQCYKLAFMVAENEDKIGQLHILDIGLHKDFIKKNQPRYQLLDYNWLKLFIKKRLQFSHKGKHGHAALIAGSEGMIGAAILAARACMRSGVGKLTCYLPVSGIPMMQTALPEAICRSIHEMDKELAANKLPGYDGIGIGSGIGQSQQSVDLFKTVIKSNSKPLLIDADGLNILSEHKELCSYIPRNSIITPHIKEFERLFGASSNDFERIRKVLELSKELGIVIVLKGKFTLIGDPGGRVHFNTTGNPGMAKAGTGDVLAGMITSFLSQGYAPFLAACFGVHLHGAAADSVVKYMAPESMLASDIIEAIGGAFTGYH